MTGRFKNDPKLKDMGLKIVIVMIIAAVLLLSFDVFTTNNDGRRQIVDEDGGVESQLCNILSDIEGVGSVDVMLQYDEEEQVTGAIVTAEGASDPVVKNDVTKAVMAVFNISAANVEVFEKKAMKNIQEDLNEK